jgi:hypothetical protein
MTEPLVLAYSWFQPGTRHNKTFARIPGRRFLRSASEIGAAFALNSQSYLAVAPGAGRGSAKRQRKCALRLLILVLDLRVFGSRQI